VRAKQAKDLDPTNPVAETLVFKSMFARRSKSNDDLRRTKEEAWWTALDTVEHAAIPFNEDYALPDPKTWKDLTEMRKRYGTDNRIRTEKEKQIEDSLTRPISMHFDNTP